MALQRFNVMDFIEQVHIFGLSNIHTFEPNISPRLFSLIFNYAKFRLLQTLLSISQRMLTLVMQCASARLEPIDCRVESTANFRLDKK